MRLNSLRAAFVLLLPLAAGCGNDATTPTVPPPPPPPPLLQDGLWTVSGSPSAILRLDPTQLTDTGQRVPAPIVTTPSAGLTPLAGVAFDGAGSLWVSDNQFHVIYRYTAAQLAVSGSPPPAFVLTAADSLVNPTGIAFDAAGNLWVANNGRSNLLAFTPAQLAGTGPLEPSVVIHSNAASLSIPLGLAFEEDGSLWVVGGTGVLVKFAPASLGTTGAPVPSVRLRISGRVLFWSVALWPKPRGLPLN